MTTRRVNSQEQPSETRIELWHFHAIIVAGAAFLVATNASQLFNFLCNQNPQAVNDTWRHPVYLKRGTYTLDLLGVKGSGSGILTLTIESNNQNLPTYSNTFDFYSAGTIFNSRFQDAAVTITQDDLYSVKGVMNTKNAASVGYTCFLNLISLYRTGD